MFYNSKYNWLTHQFRCSSLPTMMRGAKENKHTAKEEENLNKAIEAGLLLATKVKPTLTDIKTIEKGKKAQEELSQYLTIGQQEKFKYLCKMKEEKSKLEENEEIEFTFLRCLLYSGLQISDGCKTILNELFEKEVYGYQKIVTTPGMERGTLREEDGIKYVNSILGTKYKKYEGKKLGLTEEEEMFKLDPSIPFCGTPDIVCDNQIIDIKNSENISSHLKKTPANQYSAYYFQLLSYMYLSNKCCGKDIKSAYLYIILLPDSESEIFDKSRMYLYHSESEKMEKIIRENGCTKKVPDFVAFKPLHYLYSAERVIFMFDYLQKCREYLANMTKEHIAMLEENKENIELIKTK